MTAEKTQDLARWVEDHTADMFSWALHKVSDLELAKDLVQDTFMAAAEKLSSFKGDSTPKTYLFAILNNKIIDHYRKKVQKPVPMESDFLARYFTGDGEWQKSSRPGDWHENEGNLLDDDDFQKVMDDCIRALPEKWSACVNSKYLLAKKNRGYLSGTGDHHY